jgi:RHS repeat-associated protein
MNSGAAQGEMKSVWASHRHDSAGTANAQDESDLTPPLIQTLDFPTNKPVLTHASPLIVDGMVIIESGDEICAYRLSDQTQAWCYADLTGMQVNDVVAGVVLVIGQTPEKDTVSLAGLDLVTGTALWLKDLRLKADSGYSCSATVEDSLVCAVGRSVISFDLANQRIEWRRILASEASTPVILDGRLFVGSQSGKFLALDVKDGQLLWQSETEIGTTVNAVAFNDKVVVNGSDGVIHAFNSIDGMELWSHNTFSTVSCPAAYGKDALIVSSTSGVFERLDEKNGQPVWSYDPALDGMDGCPSPVIANGYVYSNFSDGSLRAISLLNGTLAWQQSLLPEDPPLQWQSIAPAVAEQILFAVVPDGTIVGFRAAVADSPQPTATIEPLPAETVTPTPTTAPSQTATSPATPTNPPAPDLTGIAVSAVAPPAAFDKTSPVNTATDQPVSLTLNWAASMGASSYQYCYDTSNDNSCSTWVSNGLATSKLVKNLLQNTTYYWQVRAVNSGGTTYANGSATTFWSFTTGILPAAFGKTTPANAVINKPVSLTLKWAASPGAASYEVCYDTSNDNACSPWVNTSTATSKVISGLTENTSYYWQVRAINAIGYTYANGFATAFWNFTTGTLPAAFGKTSPVNGANNKPVSPTISWAASTGAASYEYCFDSSNDNACSGWINIGAVTTKILSALAQNTSYYWQVRAKNAIGYTYANGSATAFWSFTTGTLPAAFAKSLPLNGAINKPVSPTLSWAASTGASSYQYCYDTSNDNACSTWVNNGTSTSKVLSGLAGNTAYYWQVRAKNTIGFTYANSSATSFWGFTTGTLPAAFVKTLPLNGSIDQPDILNLEWAASTGAASYWYCFDTSNDNTCTGWIDNGTATSVELVGLPPDTIHYWQVRAKNTIGLTYADGSSSAYWNFKTGGPLPTPSFTPSNTPSPSNTPTNTATPTDTATPTATNTATNTPTATTIPLVPCVISSNTTWDPANNPYVINSCDLTINAGITLTILPGTVVKFGSGRGITISTTGTLNAVGTTDSPILFTANTSSPVAGFWKGINFGAASQNSVLDYVIVEYGGSGGSGNINTTGALIQVINSNIRNSSNYGIFGNGIGNIIISNNTFSGSNFGIYLQGPSATVTGNTFTGGQYGLDFSGNDLVLTDNSFHDQTSHVANLLLNGIFTKSGNTFSGPARVLQLGGIVHNDLILDKTISTYVLTYGFSYDIGFKVVDNHTLTIQPGTVIKMFSLLEVDGVLNAMGTEADPIIFTSYNDDTFGGDTNGDGSASQPAKGDWGVITVSNGTLNFNYTTVRYGGGRGPCSRWVDYSMISNYGYGSGCGFGPNNVSISINHSTLSDSVGKAISLKYGTGISGSISLLNSAIQNNNGTGVYIEQGFPTTIDNSVIDGNNGFGVDVHSASAIILTNSILSNNNGYGAEFRLNSGNSLTLSGNNGSGNLYNAIHLSGTVNDLSLAPQGNLIYVYYHITIPTGKTLSLQPGTIVKLSIFGKIDVAGTLNGVGTALSPVVFTSLWDDSVGGDTNGDGDITLPAKNDWIGIQINKGKINLDYAIVRYGGYENTGVITNFFPADSATISINHSTLSDNGGPAVYLENGTGISVIAVVHNSLIYNNSYGIYSNFVPSVVNAEDNWWGSDSGPYPYGTGNAISYRTYTCGSPAHTCYDPNYYVDAYPYVGYTSSYSQNVPWNRYVSDPVNTATGNYAYARTDLSIPTRSLPLAISRAYNSANPINGHLGFGWTFSYNVSITESSLDGSATITYGDGRTVRFTKSGTAYVPPAGTFSTLVKTSALFRLTEKDQTVYAFDSIGRLAAITDRNGNLTSLNYTGTQLAAVTAPDGRNLGFSYDGSGRITSVSDPLSRSINFGYDVSGNLVTYTDPRGKVTSYAYDPGHRLTSITDANGHTFVTNTYNSDGRVSQQLDALGNITTFAYNIPAHKTTVTDARGNASIYEYDSELRIIKETDALGNYTAFTWDATNNRTSARDKRSNITSYTYDSRGNLLTSTDPLNGVTTRSYDSQNNLLTEMDALGRTTTFTYDSPGNLLSKTDALSAVTTFTYYTDTDRKGMLAASIDALLNTTHYDYNANGYLTTLTDALAGITTSTYDLAGRLLTSSDALSHTTTTTYNAVNQVLTVTDPRLGLTTSTYDEVGNLLTSSDPLGHTTTRTYTEKDALWTEMDAKGFVTTTSYDAVGNRTAVQDGNLHTTSFTFDKLNRVETSTDPLGQVTTFTYDANGNLSSVKDPLNHTTSYTYDALNRKTVVTDALTHTTTTAYDLLGNVLSITDANNKFTYYEYDALNRLKKVTDAMGGIVQYTYDALGNRLTMVDANNHTTTYTYDALSRLKTETDSLNHTTTYSYDTAGQRTSKLDAKGVTTSYTYDNTGNLTGSSNTSGSIAYTYDLAGNRSSMTDASGSTTYSYDALNRPLSIVQPGGTIAYTYDARNRLTVTLPGSLTSTSAYDAADRLQSVTDWGVRVTTYAYDAAGRLVTTAFPNGVVTTNSYDIADRLTGISTLKSATTLLSITYTLDFVSNRMSMLDADGTTSYTYDDLYRLTGVSYPTGTPASVSYTYDPMGNRLSMTQDGVATTYSYDAADRLQSTTTGVVTTSYTWDNNGQMLTKGIQTFSWDAWGRMSALNNGGTSASYSYNGDGVRVGRTINSTATSYLQDLAAGLPVVLSETTAASTLRYVYGADLVAQVDGSTPAYYHADGLGSTRVMTNSSGTATDQYGYDVFGASRSHTGSSTNAFTYTGEQVDPEGGLVFLRARYYDPVVGRFISKDSFPGMVKKPLTINRYVYTHNNPINLIDPKGDYAGWDDALALGIGAASGLLTNLTSQVIDNAINHEPIFNIDWKEAGSSAIGGAVGGITTLYLGPIAGGAAGSMATEIANEIWHGNNVDVKTVALEGVKGAVLGAVLGSKPMHRLKFYGQNDVSYKTDSGIIDNVGFTFYDFLHNAGVKTIKETVTSSIVKGMVKSADRFMGYPLGYSSFGLLSTFLLPSQGK